MQQMHRSERKQQMKQPSTFPSYLSSLAPPCDSSASSSSLPSLSQAQVPFQQSWIEAQAPFHLVIQKLHFLHLCDRKVNKI